MIASDALGLTRADFEALNSQGGAAARARGELKQKLLPWGEGVSGRLFDLGIGLDVTLMEPRGKGPMRLCLTRDAPSRALVERALEGRAHVGEGTRGQPALCLEIDAVAVHACFLLPPDASLDVKNLRARLDVVEGALELVGVLEALPEPFAIGLAEEGRKAAVRVAATQVRRLLGRVEQGGATLWVGWSLPRELVLSHVSTVGEQLADALVALAAVMRLVVWSRDNDMARLLRGEGQVGTKRKEREPRLKRRRAPPAPEPDMDWDTPLPSEGSLLALRSDDAPVVVPARAVLRSYRSRAPMVTEVDPSVVIKKGTRVRVLSGPFVGKGGVVQEVDGKGNARVMLGLLAAWVEVKDLIADAGKSKRVLISSSHHRMRGK